MAKLSVTGLDEYITNLRNMNTELRNINRGALGEGAKVAAEAVRDALDSLPIHPDRPIHGRQHDERLSGVTESEYAQICNNFGIAKHKSTGSGWNTSVGFHGTVHTPSAKYGDEVPTCLLVQAVDQGTEFRKPVRVVSKASRSCKSDVVNAIEKYIDEHVKKIME